MSTAPALKTFEITFVTPAHTAEEGPDTGKSLNFHRFMRHARDCHRELLEFLIKNSLLADVGESNLIANERKTLLECSDAVAAKINALPFVETAEERADIATIARTARRGPLQGR